MNAYARYVHIDAAVKCVSIWTETYDSSKDTYVHTEYCLGQDWDPNDLEKFCSLVDIEAAPHTVYGFVWYSDGTWITIEGEDDGGLDWKHSAMPPIPNKLHPALEKKVFIESF